MTTVLDISSKRWMSEEEATVYTTMSRETLRKKRDANIIPYRKDGAKIIYEKRDLDAMIESLELHENGRVRKKRKLNLKK